MRYLGIDYGIKRVGIALSDDGGKLAFPKKILANDSHLLNSIEEIIKEENIEEIVIGESTNLKGEPNALAQRIAKFMGELGGKFKLPIHLQKEFLTSVEARRFQPEKREADKVDASAAALILQRYLDKINKKQ